MGPGLTRFVSFVEIQIGGSSREVGYFMSIDDVAFKKKQMHSGWWRLSRETISSLYLRHNHFSCGIFFCLIPFPIPQCIAKSSNLSNEPFHVKWSKAGHEPPQNWLKLCLIEIYYELGKSWKFQVKNIDSFKRICTTSDETGSFDMKCPQLHCVKFIEFMPKKL